MDFFREVRKIFRLFGKKEKKEFDEEFRQFSLNPLFLVSQYGRVKNAVTGHIMEQKATDTRLYVKVDDNSIEKVDRLVALTWVNGWGSQKIVLHKDGDYFNNRADNLEWMTEGEWNKLIFRCETRREYSTPDLRDLLHKPVMNDDKLYYECMDLIIDGEYFSVYPLNREFKVSNFGRIKRGDKILPQKQNKAGYLYVEGSCCKYVHQMVAETFLDKLDIKNKEGHSPNIHHINGKKLDNRACNLHYVICKDHMEIHDDGNGGLICHINNGKNKCDPKCRFYQDT